MNITIKETTSKQRKHLPGSSKPVVPFLQDHTLSCGSRDRFILTEAFANDLENFIVYHVPQRISCGFSFFFFS